MNRLIDTTYFVSERQLPSDAAPDRLNLFIDKYQEELLICALGYRLYKAFADALAAVTANEPVALPQRFVDLRDGVDYNDASGRLRRWAGLASSGTKRSLIANYVYYWWVRDAVTRTSSQGEVKDQSTGSDPVSPIVKQCRAWNEMAIWIEELILFLQSKEEAYPEFADADICAIRTEFRPINAFNL